MAAIEITMTLRFTMEIYKDLYPEGWGYTEIIDHEINSVASDPESYVGLHSENVEVTGKLIEDNE